MITKRSGAAGRCICLPTAFISSVFDGMPERALEIRFCFLRSARVAEKEESKIFFFQMCW